jgi:hypothetical protein
MKINKSFVSRMSTLNTSSLARSKGSLKTKDAVLVRLSKSKQDLGGGAATPDLNQGLPSLNAQNGPSGAYIDEWLKERNEAIKRRE